MATKAGFRSSDGDLYVYFEDTSGGSCAIGTDFSDNSKLKIVMNDLVGDVTPSGTFQLSIDPDPNGDIEIVPRGSGQIVVPYLGVTGVVIQNDNTGAIYSHFNLDLPTTSDSAHGSIRINSVQFAHAFGTDNTFIGSDAGNYTMTSTNHTAIGVRALNSLTGGDADSNMNVAIGDDALTACTNGGGNVAIGSQSLSMLTTGDFNIAIGATTGSSQITTGEDNIFIDGGDNYTSSESSNVIIKNAGVLGESNTIRIGTTGAGTGQQNRAFLAGTHGVTPAGASIQPLVMDSSGQMGSQATLNVSQGGTGVTTLTSHGLIYGNGTSAVGSLAEASNGQIPIGSTGAAPVLATITAGAGIGVANGAGTITISVSGGSGVAWTEVTGTSANLAVNNGYIANNAGLVTLTLPTTAALGDTIYILGKGAGLWKVAQNASQFINIVSTSTTTGVTGALTATEQYDCLTLRCTTANNGWIASNIVGNLTVV